MLGMDRTTGQITGGLAHLRQSIVDLLTTRPGSRIMRYEYGCDAWRWLDAPANPSTFVHIYAAVAEALDRWEPRFRLEQCEVEQASSQGRVSLILEGHITEDFSNLFKGQSVQFKGIKLR